MPPIVLYMLWSFFRTECRRQNLGSALEFLVSWDSFCHRLYLETKSFLFCCKKHHFEPISPQFIENLDMLRKFCRQHRVQRRKNFQNMCCDILERNLDVQQFDKIYYFHFIKSLYTYFVSPLIRTIISTLKQTFKIRSVSSNFRPCRILFV